VAADLNKARELFVHAVGKLPPGQWDAYIAEASSGDAELERHVRHMLQVHADAGSFLERPAEFPANTSDSETASSDGPQLHDGPGAVIGPYKLVEPIGEGGMGTVWMAQQTEPVKRLVAIKLIKAGMDSKQVIARFEAERQALALMDHPNIARVLDGGTTDAGRPYFVMDLVKGVPVTKYCDDHHLTPRQRLELFIPVCQAVQHAHQKGIIHRDLKPSNVLVALYDGKPVPKVIDFGVAKAAGQSLTDKTLVTGFGNIVGTLEYMSPEQAEINQLDIDTRSDIYSLGVLLYELLTGSTPFSKKDLEKPGMLEMLRVIREQEPSKPSTKLSSSDALPTLSANRGTEPAKLTKLVRGELDWIVMKALEKDRSRRYETANGFAMDVQRYLADEQVQACPPSPAYRLRKFARRNKRALAGAAVLAVAVLVVAGTLGWAVRDRESRKQEAARDRAELQATTAARVGQVLDESESQYRWRRLPEATQLARNAVALADGGAGGPEVERRAREWLNDLDMVARIEETHARTDLERKAMLGEHVKAFREFGIDVEGLPAEVAAARIAARPIRVDLAIALDRCVEIASRAPRDGEFAKGGKIDALGDRLCQIARLADPDPLRNRLRGDPTKPGDPSARELAASVDLATTPIATLMRIGEALPKDAQGWRESIVFYTRVQQQHPGDFDVTYRLGREHFRIATFYAPGSTPEDMDRAITCLTAAKAMRPTNPFVRMILGRVLAANGRVDEALAEFRESDRLKPEQAPTNRWYIAMALWNKKERQEEALAIYRELVRADPNVYGYRKHFARALRELGKTDESIPEFREVIRISPNIAEDYNFLGVSLDDTGSWDEAIAALSEAIRLDPNSWLYRFNLGLVLTRKGLPEEAIVAFQDAVRLNPREARAHCQLGVTLRKVNRSDEAIVAYQEAVRLDPKDKNAQTGLGRTFFDRGRWDEAIAAYRAVVRLDPDDADRHADLGNAFFQKGALDEANGAAREAIRLQPNGFRGHFLLARALLRQRRTDEAIASFREADRLQKDSAHMHEWLASALAQKGQLDEAIAWYKKAIEIDRNYATAHNNLGFALQQQGKLDGAVACWKKAIEIDRTDALYHNSLGFALQKLGKLDEAIAEYREAIRLKQDYADARRNLDGALMAKHTIDEATKAIELKPTDWSSWNQRAWAYFQQKQWDRAIADYSKAIELNPDVHTTWFHRGHAHMALKKWDAVIVDYSELLKRFPGDANALYYRGWAQQNLGQWGEATADYSKAVELAPHNDTANRRLAWVLATCPDEKLRDAARAVELAKKAVLLVPKQGTLWLTLGAAHYRVRDWKAAAAALDLSIVLRNGGDSNEWFLLAMSHWQLGNKAEARKWYDKGVEWMDKNQPENKELRRFRAEAAELLRVAVEAGPPPREKK
jgi:tetratricopeptide (TPR) repeat protein/serine/threonine protein kinase